MDAFLSTTADDRQQSAIATMVDRLPHPLGHNGPYFGAADPIAQDCDKLAEHTDLFRSLEGFEADLGTAAGRIATAVIELEDVAIALAETGVDDQGAVDIAVAQLQMASRYLVDAALLAEALDDRQSQRDRAQARRDFLTLIAGKPRHTMSATERLGEEALTTWRMAKLLDRLGVICGIDRTKAWPFIDTARVDDLVDLMTLPSVDAITAMDGEALLDTLHRLEAEAADRRKRIALIHALRHAQSA